MMSSQPAGQDPARGELAGLGAVVTGGASGIGLAVDGGMNGLRLRPPGQAVR